MDYSLSDSDILNCLSGKTKVILYSDLKNVSDIDDLLKPYDSFVVLHEQYPRIGHWACLTLNRRNNELEYFNSYGDYPDDFLDLVDDGLKKKLNEDYPYLTMLMINSKYNLAYNQYKLQKLSNDIATCGRYVVVRILLKDIPLDEFVKIFKNKKYTPDEVAYKLTGNFF